MSSTGRPTSRASLKIMRKLKEKYVDKQNKLLIDKNRNSRVGCSGESKAHKNYSMPDLCDLFVLIQLLIKSVIVQKRYKIIFIKLIQFIWLKSITHLIICKKTRNKPSPINITVMGTYLLNLDRILKFLAFPSTTCCVENFYPLLLSKDIGLIKFFSLELKQILELLS